MDKGVIINSKVKNHIDDIRKRPNNLGLGVHEGLIKAKNTAFQPLFL